MRIILAFIIGVIAGAGGLWYLGTSQGRSQVHATGVQLENTAKSVHDGLTEKIQELKLSPQEVRDELARTGQVVRRKTIQAGQAIADATADGRITTTLKAKILVNHDLASHDISVSTSAGVVTLSGIVVATEDISRAMVLAMETEGVREVVSKLQVGQPANPK